MGGTQGRLAGDSGFCSTRHKGRSKRDGLFGGGEEAGAADWGLENRGRRVLGITLGPSGYYHVRTLRC